MISEEIAGQTETVSALAVADLRFEHRRETLGSGTACPRLSWRIETTARDWTQQGYEVEAYTAEGQRRGSTGRVSANQSVLVDWPFDALASRERVGVRVRVWGGGAESPWSDLYAVEAGLLEAAAWSARFITPDWEEDTSKDQPSPLLRREFDVRPALARARLYATAHGLYEAQINGAVVGDHVLDPGWTSYNHRLRYQTFDVTSMLAEGRNAIGATLGDGWYRGRLGFGGGLRNIYGDRVALLAQLELEYEDGSVEHIVSDESWRAAQGPIRRSGLYDGEVYDARLEQDGWAEAGYNDAGWSGVRPVERDLGTLVAPSGPPVRRTELVEPVATLTSPSGRTILDFGQNLVGRLRITVSGPAGTLITMRHAEVLEVGELGVRPLRHAEATDRYTLRGVGLESWEPSFTFHGFRFAEVEGWPGEIAEGSIRAVVTHSDLERTGWFECSEPLVDQLHQNVVWGMRGNFLDIPTDCPQRDERLGWTGDINVFSPSACFLYNSAGFLSSWLADLAVEQAERGGVVPFVVPDVLGSRNVPTAVWGDAAVVVPWVLYQRYGDGGVLAAQFDSMRAWVDVVGELAGERRVWDRGFQFGDWVDPAAPPDRPGDARTDPSLLATASFARSVELLSQAAGVLGRIEDEQHYRNLAAEVRAAFAAEYATSAGRLLSDAATAYSLALCYGLLPQEEQRHRAGQRLAELVRANGYHISTGFVGTPLICDALCSVGEYDAAYRLLLLRDCPSWLYPVTMGATTIWERWDSLLPDGSINPGEMTSFNHYALGAVADWLHRTVAGLAPAAPGYRRIEMSPRPGGGITHARARHITPYGPAEVAWAIRDGEIEVEATVPPNATASVTLPGKDGVALEVGSGTHRWSYPYRRPAVPRKQLTLDSKLGAIIDDPEAWDAVLAEIRRQVPQHSGQLGPRGAADMSVSQALAFTPHGWAIIQAAQDALDGLGR